MKKKPLTPRQQHLASQLGRGESPIVVAAQHINALGNVVDNGKIYHFNLPACINPGFVGGFVIVRNPNGRLTVVKVVDILPPGQYLAATEWVVGRISIGEIRNYMEAERAGMRRAELLREVEAKRAEIKSAVKALSELRTKKNEELAKLGMAVLTGAGHAHLETRARDARHAAIKQARACDDLTRELAELEARL